MAEIETNNKNTDFSQAARSDSCKILFNVTMSTFTAFKTGGNAEVIASPENVDALIHVVRTAKQFDKPITIMGNGSNILVRSSGIPGVVIRTASMSDKPEVKGTMISCTAGTSLSALCTEACEHSLTGLEFAYGIPGSAGGAVYMNAGAYGGEIRDVLKSVTHITPTGTIETVEAGNLNLEYRTSFYAKNENCGYIIVSAEFELQNGNKAEIKSKMTELLTKRKEKQPLEYPSAGSTFKRPEGHFAGALIEQCGLKGYRIGGAQVSDKHAGFIINADNATSDDIIELIDYVRQQVKEKTGVLLEPEVKIIP